MALRASGAQPTLSGFPPQHSTRCLATFRCGARRGRQQTPLAAHWQRQQQQRGRRRATDARAVLEAPSSPVSCGAHQQPAPGFSSIPEALADIAAGQMVIVTDDADRENEGDLIMAAQHVTTEAMAFMVEHTTGIICVGMEGEDLDRLELPLMVPPRENDEAMGTAFTHSVDVAAGCTTGVRAAERAATCIALAARESRPGHFKRPGHVFPLRARPGGVLARRGHTEASVDLTRLAGCAPAGALAEIVDKSDDQGNMMQTPQLAEFAARHGLKMITIDDLARHIHSGSSDGVA